jgi:hypothetical protein
MKVPARVYYIRLIDPEPPPPAGRASIDKMSIKLGARFSRVKPRHLAARFLGSFDISGVSRGIAYMLAKLEIKVSNIWDTTKRTIPSFLDDKGTLRLTRMMLEERPEYIVEGKSRLHDETQGVRGQTDH